MKLKRTNTPGRKPWRLFGVLPNGKRVTRYFDSEVAGNDWWSDAVSEIAAIGDRWRELDDRAKLDLAEFWERALGHGYTLAEAHEAVMREREKRATVRSTVACSTKQYDTDLCKMNLSRDYLKTHRMRVRHFRERFADRFVDEIEPRDLFEWLTSRNIAAKTWRNYLGDLGTFFAWAIDHKHALVNPASKVRRPKLDPREPSIFTPDEVRSFFAKLVEHYPERVPFYALGIFAGIRPEEIRRTTWSEIHWGDNLIEVGAAKAKGRKRRFVDLQPNARKWLEWAQSRDGRLPDSMGNGSYQRIRRKCEVFDLWCDDIMRHTFASMHLAAFGDETSLQRQMGHDDKETLFNHYRALVKPVVAASFWRIEPPTSGENLQMEGQESDKIRLVA